MDEKTAYAQLFLPDLGIPVAHLLESLVVGFNPHAQILALYKGGVAVRSPGPVVRYSEIPGLLTVEFFTNGGRKELTSRLYDGFLRAYGQYCEMWTDALAEFDFSS